MNKTPELYDQWNEQKKGIEFGGSKKDARIGEVWRYYEGMNIGRELSKDGRFLRPCIILQNKMGNGLFLIAPLTSQQHHGTRDHCITFLNPEAYNLKPSTIIINQIKNIDPRRLYRRLYRQCAKKTLDISFIKNDMAHVLCAYYSKNIKAIAPRGTTATGVQSPQKVDCSTNNHIIRIYRQKSSLISNIVNWFEIKYISNPLL